MATTTLKLPEDLKRRLKRLAVTARKDPHAFMIEVLAREAERLERRERFAPDCTQSEKETLASGQTFDLASTFDYLAARVSCRRPRRPRTRARRASK
jgi:predicted transcriptional regulator